MRSALAVLVVLFAGCATIGTPAITNDQKAAQLVVGQSTKDEVRALYGEPSSVSTYQGPSGTTETWVYTYGHAVVFSGSQGASLVIGFNRDGVVRHITRSRTGGS